MGMYKTIQLDITTTEDLWPHKVVNVIQQVMEEGLAKHPNGDGWDKDVDFHVNAAINHLTNPTDRNIHHAFARLMMAIAIGDGYAEKEEE